MTIDGYEIQQFDREFNSNDTRIDQKHNNKMEEQYQLLI